MVCFKRKLYTWVLDTEGVCSVFNTGLVESLVNSISTGLPSVEKVVVGMAISFLSQKKEILKKLISKGACVMHVTGKNKGKHLMAKEQAGILGGVSKLLSICCWHDILRLWASRIAHSPWGDSGWNSCLHVFMAIHDWFDDWITVVSTSSHWSQMDMNQDARTWLSVKTWHTLMFNGQW